MALPNFLNADALNNSIAAKGLSVSDIASGVAYVDYTRLDKTLVKPFLPLFVQDDKLTAVHYFGVVREHQHNAPPAKRILLIGTTVIYLCEPSSAILRVILATKVTQLVTSRDGWLGIRVDHTDREPNLLVKPSNVQNLTRILRGLWKAIKGADLEVVERSTAAADLGLDAAQPKLPPPAIVPLSTIDPAPASPAKRRRSPRNVDSLQRAPQRAGSGTASPSGSPFLDGSAGYSPVSDGAGGFSVHARTPVAENPLQSPSRAWPGVPRFLRVSMRAGNSAFFAPACGVYERQPDLVEGVPQWLKAPDASTDGAPVFLRSKNGTWAVVQPPRGAILNALGKHGGILLPHSMKDHGGWDSSGVTISIVQGRNATMPVTFADQKDERNDIQEHLEKWRFGVSDQPSKPAARVSPRGEDCDDEEKDATQPAATPADRLARQRAVNPAHLSAGDSPNRHSSYHFGTSLGPSGSQHPSDASLKAPDSIRTSPQHSLLVASTPASGNRQAEPSPISPVAFVSPTDPLKELNEEVQRLKVKVGNLREVSGAQAKKLARFEQLTTESAADRLAMFEAFNTPDAAERAEVRLGLALHPVSDVAEGIIASLMKEADTAEFNLSDLRAQASDLSDQVAARRADEVKLKQKLAATEMVRNDSKDQLKTIMADMKQLVSRAQAAAAAKEEKIQELGQLKAQHTKQVRQAKVAHQRRVAELQQKIAQLMGTATEKPKALVALESPQREIRRLDAEIAGVKKEIEALESERKTLADAEEEAGRDAAADIDRIAEVCNQLSMALTRIDELEGEASNAHSLRYHLERKREEVADMDANIKKAVGTLKELRRQYDHRLATTAHGHDAALKKLKQLQLTQASVAERTARAVRRVQEEQRGAIEKVQQTAEALARKRKAVTAEAAANEEKTRWKYEQQLLLSRLADSSSTSTGAAPGGPADGTWHGLQDLQSPNPLGGADGRLSPHAPEEGDMSVGERVAREQEGIQSRLSDLDGGLLSLQSEIVALDATEAETKKKRDAAYTQLVQQERVLIDSDPSEEIEVSLPFAPPVFHTSASLKEGNARQAARQRTEGIPKRCN
ncbi:hypothetical protein DIPPA_01455 [Diplonema papillatum]|nr:hypothetical protein DIPPA_01455 [Diplonema papillatum]